LAAFVQLLLLYLQNQILLLVFGIIENLLNNDVRLNKIVVVLVFNSFYKRQLVVILQAFEKD
jgi:hypothetical protein